MASVKRNLTGLESPFQVNDLIVTKTDTRGRLTYANEVFLRVSHLALSDALGQPHSIVRHPHMPRCVFELMWGTIQAGKEFFGYVLNRATNGDHYWVFAHITPSHDANGALIGFHSNRRKPDPAQIATVTPIYARLVEAEQREANAKEGQRRGATLFNSMLAERKLSYDQFAFSL